jgi:hypothetical protein
MANVGFAPREVRLVILTVGLILTGLAGGVQAADCGNLMCVDGTLAGGAAPLAITLGVLALLATITTIQRIVVTLNQASHEG